MIPEKIVNLSRRQFLLTSVTLGAGLTLGISLVAYRDKAETGPGKVSGKIIADTPFEPNAFIRIGSDNRITVIIKHLEMGQGTYTGLATLVAEELDAAWSQIKVEGAPANAKLYNNLLWGTRQGTGGSSAIANSFEQMRKAGAAARQMLVAAAAKKWNSSADEITVREGVLRHEASDQQATFGEMAELAANEPVPQKIFLKEVDDFRLIGKKDLPRKDSHDKVYGTAIFTQDIKLPGMLTAVVAHPPRFGAKVKSFDATAAKAVKGVVDVVKIPNAVAVLGKDFWSAKKGRDALKVEWDESNAFKLGSDEIMAQYKNLAKTPGVVARKDGDVTKALNGASKTVEAFFEFPYLAHAAMEPMNCVLKITKDGCEIWNGEQSQTSDQKRVAKILGLKPEQVKINMLYAGGSFGRRANPHSDYLVETASIAKAINGKAPVKLVWTREDDMQAGYYRPMYFHHIKAGLDTSGNPVAWQHRIVGQSIRDSAKNNLRNNLDKKPFFLRILSSAKSLIASVKSKKIQNRVDRSSVEGAANMPYSIPNITVDLHSPQLPVPVQWWRSVGSTHTAFAVETCIDELAAKANQDPLEFRRTLLKDHPRHRGVMELAAKKAGWGTPLATGKGRGIAVHKSFKSYVAQVAEVTVHKDKTFTVDRVVIAVDCGIAVNPDIIHAQMEGGMGFGLSAALTSKITLKDGYVEQSNFDGYTVLRIDKMPQVEVHIVNSAQPPTGVGEPGTPVIAPAVANALYSVTGKRLYELPLKLTS